MRNLTKALAAISLLVPASSYALGIGDIKLHSALNQNLKAEISLVVSENENASDIKVRLAPPEKFDEAGVPWSYFLSKIHFKTETKSNGSVIIKLSSNEALKEPFLDFLVEVTWPKGSLYREFTVLVDPPSNYPQAKTSTYKQNTKSSTEHKSVAIKTVKKNVKRKPTIILEPVVESKPVKQVVETKTDESVVENEPVKEVAETKTDESVVENEPVKEVAETEIDEPAVDSEPVKKVIEPTTETKIITPITEELSAELDMTAEVDELPVENTMTSTKIDALGEEEVSKTTAVVKNKTKPTKVSTKRNSKNKTRRNNLSLDSVILDKDGTVKAAVSVQPVKSVKEYGPTKKNTSLYKIAKQVKPHSNVSVDQMMYAIYQANPEAFYDDNINALRTNQVLKIPTEETVSKITPSDVKKYSTPKHNSLKKSAVSTQKEPVELKKESFEVKKELIDIEKEFQVENEQVDVTKEPIKKSRVKVRKTPKAKLKLRLPRQHKTTVKTETLVADATETNDSEQENTNRLTDANQDLKIQLKKLKTQLAIVEKTLAVRSQRLAALEQQLHDKSTDKVVIDKTDEKIAEAKAASEKKALEEQKKAAKIVAEKALAEKKIADAKAVADKKLADAKMAEKAAADKKIADAKIAADKALLDKQLVDAKTASEKVLAEKKIADAKAVADKKLADAKVAEKAAADKKIADAKIAADKALLDKQLVDAKTASEKVLAEKKIADAKAVADKKLADAKVAEKAAADKKIADAKIAADKAKAEADAKAKTEAEKKLADAKVAADKAAADKAIADRAAVEKIRKEREAKIAAELKAKADALAKRTPSPVVPAISPVINAQVTHPKPPIVVVEPVVETDWLTNSYYLGLAGIGILSLAIWVWLFLRKRKVEGASTEVESMFTESSEINLPDDEDEFSVAGIDDNSSFMFGGESSFLSDDNDFDAFEVDQDEVDPISEADVYLAYGRYQQAEELIRQAIHDLPDRDECKFKLLEIFCVNGNKKGFEDYIRELANSGKKSNRAFWSKVVEMGQEIIPNSPLLTMTEETKESVDNTATSNLNRVKAEITSAKIAEEDILESDLSIFDSDDDETEEAENALKNISPKTVLLRKDAPTDFQEQLVTHDDDFDLSMFDEEPPKAISSKLEKPKVAENKEEFDLSMFDDEPLETTNSDFEVPSNNVEFDLSEFDDEPSEAINAVPVEPEIPGNNVEFDLSMFDDEPLEAINAAPAELEIPGNNVEFDLSEFDDEPSEAINAVPVEPEIPGNNVEFDLSMFDDEPLEAINAAPAELEIPGNNVEFDLSMFDDEPPEAINAAPVEPEIQGNNVEFDLSEFDDEPSEAINAAPVEPEIPGNNVEFDLSEFDDEPSEAINAAPVEPEIPGNNVEFDLSMFDDESSASETLLESENDFDLSAFDAEIAVDGTSSETEFDLSSLSNQLNEEASELDLSSFDSEFDFSSLNETEQKPKNATDVSFESEGDEIEFDLSSFDDIDEFTTTENQSKKIIDFDFDDSNESLSEDEFTDLDDDINGLDTKIDLARAFIDMGDSNTAKTIAEKVLKEGNNAQKIIAQQLIDSLS